MPTGIYQRKKHWKRTNEAKETMRQRMLKEWKEGKGKGFQKGNQFGKNTAGEKHGHWKGGIKYYPSRNTTYRWIRIGIRKYVAEHRYIMEQHLGRKLNSNEAVHHIDGNGLNNKLENLQLMKWGDHKRIHRNPYKHKDFMCKCGNTKYFAKEYCKKCYDHQYHQLHPIK